MIRTLVAVALAAVCAPSPWAGPARAGPAAQAREALAAWDLRAARMGADGVLRVVLNRRRVETEVYLAVIRSGICLSALSGGGYAGVRSVEVVNRFEAQGFVYEKGVEDCAALLDLPAGDLRGEIMVTGATHMF